MVSYKHCVYALSIMFTLLNNQFIKSSDLSELQTRKYISHLLNNLFIPYNHPIAHQQHLNTFSHELTNDLTRNLGSYPHWYSLSKVYNDHQIYQEVINESLSFIEKCARNCAINEVQHYYSEQNNNQKIFVDKVVNFLMKELTTKINKSSILPEGILTGYFGTALTTKVQNLVDKELKKEAARIEKINARTKCSICLSSFNIKTNRKITLTCGHSLCLACLKTLWHKMGSSISCSKCNSKINISDHVQGLWVTPSPNAGDASNSGNNENYQYNADNTNYTYNYQTQY